MPNTTNKPNAKPESDIRALFSSLDPDVMLDTEQLAAIANNSPITVKAWRQQGRGPKFHRLGRSVRYRVGDVREWLADAASAAA